MRPALEIQLREAQVTAGGTSTRATHTEDVGEIATHGRIAPDAQSELLALHVGPPDSSRLPFANDLFGPARERV